MKIKLDYWQYHTNKVGIYLSVFFILLSGLLLYLKKIDTDITNYNRYTQDIQDIRVLNDKLDSYFLHPYKLIDYDRANDINSQILLKIDSLQEKEFIELVGISNKIYVQKLKKLFEQKNIYFEDFKSINARVTNSLHYMFDLRKNLESKLVQDANLKEIVDNIFFTFAKVLMDVPYNKNELKSYLHRLKSINNDKLISHLILHAQSFFEKVDTINTITKNATNLAIPTVLENLTSELRQSYTYSREWQNIIAFIFFIFAFLILVLLLFVFRKINQNTLELEAFKYAIENSDNSIVVTNKNREIVFVNGTFEKRTGYSKDEVLGKNPNILKSGLVPDKVYQEMNKALFKGDIWQGELINKRKDGSIFYEKLSIMPVIIKNKIVQYIGIKLDITQYKEQEQRLKQAATVYENIGDGILITDKNQTILSVNPAFEEIFGYSKDELIGKEPMLIQTKQRDQLFYDQMWHKARYANRWSGKVYNKTKDGKILPIWLTIAVIKDKDGNIQNYIGIYTDLSEIIATQEKAEYLAYHDSLTNLPNRVYLDMHLSEMIKVASTSNHQLAILFIDLDRFKIINDTLGHSVGDAMLIEVGNRIKNIIDSDTLFARIGGDEFVIVLSDTKARQKAIILAEQILNVVRKPINAYSYHLNTTASIGITLYPDHAKDKQELLQYADAAMYAAKENGKDTFMFYTTKLSLDVKDRLNIEQELSKALQNNEFYLYYQPQYDIQSGKITGIEALIRWENQKLGFVSPDEFIEIAEETGMIVSIGYYVIQEACSVYMRLKKLGYELDIISINVATIQFREDDFVQKVKEIFAKTGIEAKNVELEITERFLMEFSIQKMSIVENLRSLGCHISIDDFGTGYSSMSYLKKLPIDTIKIDRSFIDEVPYNNHDVVVTKAIIALSKNLGYQVIAEGIENKEQEEFLKKNECDRGQGYYFAKPMSEDDLIEFLKSKSSDYYSPNE
jgi:diguanylate cyclase (GGDEF)-like protein/PAS domain S-box-containing protein